MWFALTSAALSNPRDFSRFHGKSYSHPLLEIMDGHVAPFFSSKMWRNQNQQSAMHCPTFSTFTSGASRNRGSFVCRKELKLNAVS